MSDRERTLEHASDRRRMVSWQLRQRGLVDERVLLAMETVPRHRFVPQHLLHAAYDDCPLGLEQGQTISQPYMVARSCELAQLGREGAPKQRVLDVGTGSGYQAAVLAQLCAQVVSIERLPALAERARRTLAELGIANVEVVVGDGTQGYPPRAPYDAIVVAAGGPSVPDALFEQLAPGGRLVIPLGPHDMQHLTVVHKLASGAREQVAHDACRYVPLRGSGGWADRGEPQNAAD